MFISREDDPEERENLIMKEEQSHLLQRDVLESGLGSKDLALPGYSAGDQPELKQNGD